MELALRITLAAGIALFTVSLSQAGKFADASAEVIKRPLCGLVTMGNLRFLRTGEQPDNALREATVHPGIYAASIVNIRWRDIEPAPEVFNFTAIDAALGLIRSYNEKVSAPKMKAKLRVDAALNASSWVKALSGGAVKIDVFDHQEEIPRFWTEPYKVAWRLLQSELAKRYDTDPMLGEVAVSSCTSVSAEPFVLPLNPSSITNLLAAGFADDKYLLCLSSAQKDYAAWAQTPLDFTYDMYHRIDSHHLIADPSIVIGLMNAWRETLGRRGIIATHGLRANALRPAAALLYEEIARLGPPIAFQTYSPFVNFSEAIARGLRYRATELEMWDTVDAGGLAQFTGEELRRWRSLLPCETAPLRDKAF